MMYDTDDDREFENKYGNPVKYLSNECINCGRVRVELWSCGQKICEKCHFNQDTKEFESGIFSKFI